MMDCPPRDTLAALLTAPLDDPLMENLEEHLGDCSRCQDTVLELTGATEQEWAYWRQLCQLPKRKPKRE